MILLQLVERQLLMLALIGAIGALPTTLLGEAFDAPSRIALAPVFGLCLGTSVTTTLVWFFPTNETAFVVPGLAALSVLGSLVLGRRRASHTSPETHRDPAKIRGRIIDAAQILLVVIAISAPITYTLAQHNTVGPVTYEVYDNEGYVATADAMQFVSLRQADAAKGTSGNLIISFWGHIAKKSNYLDAEALSSNANVLVGLHATDTQSSYLIVFLVVGGLGAYAVTRVALRRRSWAAMVAGVLFGGAFYFQLFFDGSQAAICGLATLGPLAAVGYEALRRASLRNVLLVGLLCAGIVGLYPLFVPLVFLVALIIVLANIAHRRSRIDRSAVASAAVKIGVLLMVTLGLNLVATIRAFQFLVNLHSSLGGQPPYKLGLTVLPGWLTQSRDFYSLAFSNKEVSANLFLSLGVPALALGLVVVGLRRHPITWIAVTIVGVAALLGWYGLQGSSITGLRACGYCEDRSLLPVAPILGILVAVGLGAAGASARRAISWLGGAAAITVLVAAGYALWQEQASFSSGSYFLSPSVRSALSHLPTTSHPTLELEGFDEGPNPPGEQLLVYEAAEESDWGRISLPGDVNSNSSLAYVGTHPLTGPQFKPQYNYVLTRFKDVHTQRTLVVSSGPIALEKRTSALDISTDYGFTLLSEAVDPEGMVWVAGPMQFVIVGHPKGDAAHALLRFELAAGSHVSVVPQAGLKARQAGSVLSICVPARGAAPVETASITLTFDDEPVLRWMRAASGICRST